MAITPVKTNNAPDIPSSITPALAASFPANLESAVTIANIAKIAEITAKDLPKPEGLIFSSILNACIINNSEAAIPSIPSPALPEFSPPNLLTNINPPSRPNTMMKAAIFCFILDRSRAAISSKIPTIIFKAAAIAITVTADPNFTLEQANAINDSPAIADIKVPIDSLMFSDFKFDTSSNALTSIFIEAANAIKKREPLDKLGANLPNIPANNDNPVAKAPIMSKSTASLLLSSSSIFFSEATRIKIAAAIAVSEKEVFLKEAVLPSFPIIADAPTNNPVSAISAPTADHNFVMST